MESERGNKKTPLDGLKKCQVASCRNGVNTEASQKEVNCFGDQWIQGLLGVLTQLNCRIWRRLVLIDYGF